MSEVDQYEYLKSCEPQGINLDSPYVSKQWNYTNDINQGIYTNSSLTLIQYNLSNLFNSSTLINSSDCFLIIPTVTCVRLTNGNNGNAVAPANSAFAIASLKTNTANIIHQIDLQLDGKNTVQLQPYSGLMFGFDLASKMSKDDLTLHGKIKGWSQQLDNPNSMYYTGNYGANNSSTITAQQLATAQGTGTAGLSRFGMAGPGIANNSPWGQGNSVNGGEVSVPVQSQYGSQNYNTVNGAIQERINSISFAQPVNQANATGTYNNFFGTIATSNTYNQEFKPYSQIINGDIVYYDYLYIKLSDIAGIMENIGLIRKFNGILRIYVNTGLITCSVEDNGANTGYSILNFRGLNYSTFTNSCPITINSLGRTANYSAAAFTDITAGFFIGRSPSYAITTYGGGTPATVNFQANYQSQIQSTRFYYPNIVLDPLKMSDYLASQQSKTVVNKQFLYNTYSNINPGASFSQLIQSGVRNIKAIVIMPLIAQAVNGFSQFQSPFDPCGGFSFAPLSLINLNVLVGGTQLRTSSLSYQYEDWIEEVALYGRTSSSEYGTESSLVSKEWWDNNRIYLLNVRNTLDDALTPRNVVINFINNNNVAIDLYFFIVYEDEWVINCATGEVNQKQ
jgi:hypothetical protein